MAQEACALRGLLATARGLPVNALVMQVRPLQDSVQWQSAVEHERLVEQLGGGPEDEGENEGGGLAENQGLVVLG